MIDPPASSPAAFKRIVFGGAFLALALAVMWVPTAPAAAVTYDEGTYGADVYQAQSTDALADPSTSPSTSTGTGSTDETLTSPDRGESTGTDTTPTDHALVQRLDGFWWVVLGIGALAGLLGLIVMLVFRRRRDRSGDVAAR